MHSPKTLASTPRSNTTHTPELSLTKATLAALDVKASESSSKYSYHLRPKVSQLEPIASPSRLPLAQSKPLNISHRRYSHQAKGREEFGELYQRGAVMQTSAPCQSDPLQYHLDQFPVWKGLKHRSPRPEGPLLPTLAGIEAEWKDIHETRVRRGYETVSTVKSSRIPTRHLPLIARSPHYPREESIVSQQQQTMTPRGVTFYTTGSETEEEEEKPKKNTLYWTPKSFKNLFLPSVPHPKGIGTNDYVAGLLK